MVNLFCPRATEPTPTLLHPPSLPYNSQRRLQPVVMFSKGIRKYYADIGVTSDRHVGGRCKGIRTSGRPTTRVRGDEEPPTEASGTLGHTRTWIQLNEYRETWTVHRLGMETKIVVRVLGITRFGRGGP